MTPRRSRQSGRQSTTSRRTSKSLAELIAELPPGRAAAVFTHSSFAADRIESYERLEFLGDSVLELAKIRSHVVSRASCAVVAESLGLGERLRESASAVPGEELERLARNRNVLAALLEAALAATYLEHGFEHVEPAIVEAFDSVIEFARTNQVDAKTELQEVLARTGRSVSYALLDAVGPAHEQTFTAAVLIDGTEAGVGRGSSKKEAEQVAAQEALTRLGG